jgi:hypothetical protein
MEAKEALLNKYPQKIVADYFEQGYVFDLEEEYFDIAWQYPLISFVIMAMWQRDYNILNLDVMIDDKSEKESNKIHLMYEGTSWRAGMLRARFEKWQHYGPVKEYMGVYDCLSYLEQFYGRNKQTIDNYYFKPYFKSAG